MEPIFNKKVAKKCNLWDRKQYTYALYTFDKFNNYGLEKKKKKRGKRGEKRRRGFQLKEKRRRVWIELIVAEN